jgi:tetratricopeptide (TPR) repeat protein
MPQMRRWLSVCLGLVMGVAGCRRSQPEERSLSMPVAAASAPVLELPSVRKDAASHSHGQPLAVCHAEGLDPLSAARKFYDAERYEEALSCAAQATALTPEDPQAHSERAAALSALGRYDDAQLSYARALALDPEHLDGLLGAAHLYAVSLPSTRERDELASAYAERGVTLAGEASDEKLVAQFALLSAMAFNDLGQAKDALERADQVLSLEAKNREAAYERAVALFELCRFPEAKTAFSSMLDDPQRSAHAHHHLGLILEREGRAKQSERHLAKARKLQPEDFPEPQGINETDFRAEVEQAVASLPLDMRKDLAGIPVTAEELPREDDLVSGDPPLSPSILGLFRGPPLGDRCPDDLKGPCRSVALYRRNLARAVRTREELLEQIRVTLLHEVGHLRGEDDYELAARGLE